MTARLVSVALSRVTFGLQLLVAGLLLPSLVGESAESPGHFTPLVPLPAPRVVAQAEEHPGGLFAASRIVDGAVATEYASFGKGTDTYLVFDFGQPVLLAAFQHVDRQDVATVEAAQLTFSDQPDLQSVLGTHEVDHVGTRGGTTTSVFAQPITARYVRWQVTQLNPQGHSCAGGGEMRFFTVGDIDTSPVRDVVTLQGVQAVLRDAAGARQPLLVKIQHVYAEPVDVVLKVGDLPPVPTRLQYGEQIVSMQLPASDADRLLPLEMQIDGQTVLQQQSPVPAVRHWELHFLPHSHVDIGFTHVQTDVEQRQWAYLRQAMEFARNTASYPAEARFKWNCEVMWAVDSFLQQASPEERAAFAQAVRDGAIHLDGLYGNELTGLCRPEELMRLVDRAQRLSAELGVTVDAAMISDVPGYTWGVVPALVQSGIKYLSIGPNHVHRIGGTLEQWADRPFYWVSPSGQEKLLCWMAGKAYSWFHQSRVGTLTRNSAPDPFFEYLNELQQDGYPYDMVQIRYSIGIDGVGGDNGPPDQELSEFVKAWNERYVWPQMVISTTSQVMRTFEQRYGKQIPEVRGDFTPYWEDGAASSARETGLTRMAAERLVQAEALWSILAPDQFPAAEFDAAWRDVLLYNEHTWGAHCSISEPDSPFTQSQWKIKQQFALQADERAHTLLRRALERQPQPTTVAAIDVWNTTSWVRTDLVVCETDLPLAGQVVKDLAGNLVPSELTRRGHLAFVAQDVPPHGSRRYLLEAGTPVATGQAKVEGNVLDNGRVRVEVDPNTGTLISLRRAGIDHEFASVANGRGLNDYHYVPGRHATSQHLAQPPRIEALTSNGLTASLGVFAEVPGARQWIAVIRVVDGLDRVDIVNMLDKTEVRAQESVHWGFPFLVPDGAMRIDIPWGVMQPDVDQLPGACKNYLITGRGVDVSNAQVGVTWASLDAPLIEAGDIHVDVTSPFESKAWIQQLGPTQTLFSYAMNNYWETNYKASQEGMTTFRYSLQPHGLYDAAAAARFGLERSQPLVAVPVSPEAAPIDSLLRLDGDPGVIVSSLRPSRDGQAWMVRLFNTSAGPASVEMRWRAPGPPALVHSSPREEKGSVLTGPVTLPPLGILTLRAERTGSTP